MDTWPKAFSGSSLARGKWLLLALALFAILLEVVQVLSLPVRPCHFPQIPDHHGAFRKLRNRYENERIQGAEPWKNCSRRHLQFPPRKIQSLANKWEKLEAVEAELALVIPVLQNVSEDASQVLEFLVPLKDHLALCIRHTPSHHQKSSRLQLFKEEIQNFSTSSAQQSPKCLEAAVGLNIVRLLEEDIGHLRHHFRRHSHPRQASN